MQLKNKMVVHWFAANECNNRNTSHYMEYITTNKTNKKDNRDNPEVYIVLLLYWKKADTGFLSYYLSLLQPQMDYISYRNITNQYSNQSEFTKLHGW